MALINSMSTRGKITLAACALGFLAAAVFIVKMAGAPSYTTVMTGVDPAKTSQITTALTAAGVPFELQNGGTAVGVQKGKETAANVALAGQGPQLGHHAAGLRDPRQAEAGRLQPAAADRLPARPGGHDRQHDRPDRRRRRRAGPPHAAARTTSSPTSRSPRPRPCCSRRTPAAWTPPRSRASPTSWPPRSPTSRPPRHDHRRLRRDAVALGRRRGRWRWWHRRPAEQDRGRGRYNASSEASLQALLDRTLGPDKAQVVGPLRPQRRQDRSAGADLRQARSSRSPRRRAPSR